MNEDFIRFSMPTAMPAPAPSSMEEQLTPWMKQPAPTTSLSGTHQGATGSPLPTKTSVFNPLLSMEPQENQPEKEQEVQTPNKPLFPMTTMMDQPVSPRACEWHTDDMIDDSHMRRELKMLIGRPPETLSEDERLRLDFLLNSVQLDHDDDTGPLYDPTGTIHSPPRPPPSFLQSAPLQQTPTPPFSQTVPPSSMLLPNSPVLHGPAGTHFSVASNATTEPAYSIDSHPPSLNIGIEDDLALALRLQREEEDRVGQLRRQQYQRHHQHQSNTQRQQQQTQSMFGDCTIS